MSQVWVPDPEIEPDLSHLVCEEETVYNRFSERQQRLLPHLLFTSWPEGKPFEALSDVGIFYAIDEPAIAPDFMLSMGVTPRPLSSNPKDKSYLVWVYGKPPDLCIEVVSNKKGGELGRKMKLYAHIGVTYYVVFDPDQLLGERKLRAFRLSGGRYTEMLVTEPVFLEELGLGITLWDGVIEDTPGCFLRFVGKDGRLLLTGSERMVEDQKQLADSQSQLAESQIQLAETQARLAQAEHEGARAARQALHDVARRLLAQGLDKAAVASATGLTSQDLDEI